MPKGRRTVRRAGRESDLDNLGRVVIRAGLSSAVANTERVVLSIAETALVTRGATQLPSLVVHVVDTHASALGLGHGADEAGGGHDSEGKRELHCDCMRGELGINWRPGIVWSKDNGRMDL